jgi:hypothetical protein
LLNTVNGGKIEEKIKSNKKKKKSCVTVISVNPVHNHKEISYVVNLKVIEYESQTYKT